MRDPLGCEYTGSSYVLRQKKKHTDAFAVVITLRVNIVLRIQHSYTHVNTYLHGTWWGHTVLIHNALQYYCCLPKVILMARRFWCRILVDFYRPRSVVRGKVMFSQVSVRLFAGGGGGVPCPGYPVQEEGAGYILSWSCLGGRENWSLSLDCTSSPLSLPYSPPFSLRLVQHVNGTYCWRVIFVECS